MDFNKIPDDRKIQFANLIGGMGKAMLTFFFGLMIIVALWTITKNLPEPTNYAPVAEAAPNVPWDYEIFKDVEFTNPATTEQVAWGRKLITETADHLGPNSPNPIAGNNLNCSSCHLDGGGKPF
ncbi:MAG: hypothetical protein RLZZ599_77, partial [Bacteroidota bacterium]